MLIAENYNFPDRVKTVSVRILEEHTRYCEMLAEAFVYKANGDTEKAVAAMEAMNVEMSKREPYLERYLDHELALRKLTLAAKV